MVEGDLKECFYCGSCRHDLKACPSKNLQLSSRVFTRFGYLSIGHISNCFAGAFSNPEQHNESVASLKASDGQTISGQNEVLVAYHTFFDLTEIFQLRFLKRVWQTEAATWDMLYSAGEQREEGGPLWLILDCIRVGQTDKAEQFLKTAQDKNPDDYRLYMATAFLELERGNHFEALYQFERARECSRNKLQQIHALFLITRLHEVLKAYEKAEEKVHDIIYLDRDCLEAQYYKIVLQAKRVFHDEDIVKLQKIILQQPEFFLYALIDPRLLPIQGLVEQLLTEMLESIRIETEDAGRAAEAKVNAMIEWLDEENEIYQENKTLVDKIRQLAAQDGYLGYIEAKDIATSLISRYHLIQQTVRINLLRQIASQDNHLRRYEIYWRKYPLKGFFRTVELLLHETRQKLNYAANLAKSDQANAFKQARRMAEETAPGLKEMVTIAGRMASLENGINVLRSFGKYLLIAEVIAFVIAALVIPIGSSAIAHLYPDLNWAVFENIEQYHKHAFGIGSVAGFLIAIVLTLRDTPRS
jgi:tetratricopeptide (TPR) repeat protein